MDYIDLPLISNKMGVITNLILTKNSQEQESTNFHLNTPENRNSVTMTNEL